MTKPAPTIRHQIAVGFALVLVMALMTIFAVVEWKVKPDLITQRHEKITISQHGLLDLLNAKLGQVELLTSTMALTGTILPKDASLFRTTFPPILNNYGDPAIAGGGIWPEPEAFKKRGSTAQFLLGTLGKNHGLLRRL